MYVLVLWFILILTSFFLPKSCVLLLFAVFKFGFSHVQLNWCRGVVCTVARIHSNLEFTNRQLTTTNASFTFASIPEFYK